MARPLASAHSPPFTPAPNTRLHLSNPSASATALLAEIFDRCTWRHMCVRSGKPCGPVLRARILPIGAQEAKRPGYTEFWEADIRAFIFPGQGSQAVGMGKGLADASPAARAVFQEVDDALGQHLSRLMWEGPESDLTLTANAQPAIMAVSIAALRVLEAEAGLVLADKAAFVAGHSLGEYTALAAAGALGLADTARLLRLRGEAMQAAVPVGVGAMAALIGLDFDAVVAIAEEAAQGQVCAAANDNAPGQVVVSGHAEAVARAMALAKPRGARMTVLLPVSAPFHCVLMQPAADAMAAALADADLKSPFVPLVANVTAAPVAAPDDIRRLLVEQVTGTVRWRESVLAMADLGVTSFVELGAKVLGPMVRRITPDAKNLSAVDMAGIETLTREL
jgi:[acyl-carrier-protein] S-malonyltransferase